MERHDHITEKLTGYALGELSPLVRARVQVHLSDCAPCAAAARELSESFEAVGLSARPIAPSAAVKARTLAAVESRVTLRTAPTGDARSTGTPSRHWLAVAALALLVLGGMLFLSQQRVARLLDERRAAHADVARLADDAAIVASQADLAVAILTAPDMRQIALQGFDRSRDAAARAYWSGTKGLLIVADRLPVPPPGRLYQVWLIGSGTPSPVSAAVTWGSESRLISARPNSEACATPADSISCSSSA